MNKDISIVIDYFRSVNDIPEVVEIDDSSAIFCCEWMIDKADDFGATLVSEMFVCKEQPLFFVTISPAKTSSRYDDEERRFVEEKTSHLR